MIYDILVLGAGWTSTFLIPLMEEGRFKWAATSTTGRDSTIKWKFDPDASSSSSEASFRTLPEAHHILVTFPVLGERSARALMDGYGATHGTGDVRWIQLGSTGIFQSVAQPDLWITRHSRYDKESGRARAEDALKAAGGVVLNLSGLWGGTRQPRHFTKALFPSKQDVAAKRSLHMVHGRDVARAILAVVSDWPGPSRWMLTDGFVYDWWSLLAGWGTESSSDKDDKDDKDDDSEGDVKGEAVKWVWECMNEQGVRALPRSMESLGRCYDSREFWETFKLTPVRARI